MFSALSTTAKLHHVTPLPGVSFEAAIEKIHDHDLLMRLDPELDHYETLPAEEKAPLTKRYKVTDHMHTLPKGLWDTTVTFEAQMTDTDDGVVWVIKAPLGLVQQTRWSIMRSGHVEKGEHAGGEGRVGGAQGGDGHGHGDRDAASGGSEGSEWSLVEEVEIRASRLLMGTVKSKCEQNWRGIHAKFLGHLQDGLGPK